MKSSGILVVLVLFVSTFSSIAHADQVTLTFQEGDGSAYSSTAGATATSLSASNGGALPVLSVASQYDFPIYVSYVAFPDVIGTAQGQVPPGSTVQFASLQLTRVASSANTATVRPVTGAWNEGTLTSENMPGSGEVIATIAAGDAGNYTTNITGLVQSWVSGSPNYGVSIWPGYTTGHVDEAFHSDDALTAAYRPLLKVIFTPPAVQPVEQSTWGKVKALYR